jgi:hypothetical protein
MDRLQLDDVVLNLPLAFKSIVGLINIEFSGFQFLDLESFQISNVLLSELL